VLLHNLDFPLLITGRDFFLQAPVLTITTRRSIKAVSEKTNTVVVVLELVLKANSHLRILNNLKN